MSWTYFVDWPWSRKHLAAPREAFVVGGDRSRFTAGA